MVLSFLLVRIQRGSRRAAVQMVCSPVEEDGSSLADLVRYGYINFGAVGRAGRGHFS